MLPHLHRDWAHMLPHLHRDWARRCRSDAACSTRVDRGAVRAALTAAAQSRSEETSVETSAAPAHAQQQSVLRVPSRFRWPLLHASRTGGAYTTSSGPSRARTWSRHAAFSPLCPHTSLACVPVPVQMWEAAPSPGAEFSRGELSPTANFSMDEPSPGADAAGVSPSQSRCGCGSGEPSRTACARRPTRAASAAVHRMGGEIRSKS